MTTIDATHEGRHIIYRIRKDNSISYSVLPIVGGLLDCLIHCITTNPTIEADTPLGELFGNSE